jgi:hypothetical protein
MIHGRDARARSAFGWGLALSFIAAACGGKSNTAAPASNGGGPTGAGAAADGGTGVVNGGEPSSPAGGRNGAGAGRANGGGSVEQGGVTATAGQPALGGGAGSGGASGEAGSAGGAGGADCLDVCEAHGGQCCFDGAECVSPSGDCTIEVLAATISSVHDYAALEQKMAGLDPTLSVSLSDADIVKAGITDPFAPRIELHLSAAASAVAAPLEQDYLNPFRVSCAGELLFVGVVYIEYGAAAIETPVMHVSRAADQHIVLRLGAWQGAWVLSSVPPGAEALAQRLDRPELRGALCRAGVLGQL